MATHPKDRFDSVPDDLLRTGAHRAPAGKGRGWFALAWAVLATVVLVAAGLFALAVTDGRVKLPFDSAATATASPTPSATPTPQATLNPSIPITVLNGTTTNGLANAVGDNLVAQGWGGASVDIGARASASTSDIKKTVVYYSDPANAAAARGLVQALKVGTIQLSTAYTESPLTIVLGSDYVLPPK